MSVITLLRLPDVRDGLKPVYRRILSHHAPPGLTKRTLSQVGTGGGRCAG